MTKQPKPQNPRIIFNAPTDPAYWQALGRFIEVFASTETAIFSLLTFYAKVSPAAAKALFSGTRVDASIKLIRRMVAVDDPGEERRKELEIAFTQLSAINDARNDIIHYGSFATTAGRMTTNIVRAHLAENITWRPTSVSILNAMTEDLHRITMHLMLHEQHPEADATRDRLSALSMMPPWLYKPPPDHEMKLNKPARRDRRRSPAPRDRR